MSGGVGEGWVREGGREGGRGERVSGGVGKEGEEGREGGESEWRGG